MGFQDSWWNISISSLVILAASVFKTTCRKTGRQTNAGKKHNPETAISVGKNFTLRDQADNWITQAHL